MAFSLWCRLPLGDFRLRLARRFHVTPDIGEALIEESIVTNAALAAHSIQEEFGTSDPAEMQTVYGVYLLETRQVWAPHVDKMKAIGLATAPRNPPGFIELGNAILQSDRIKSLLQP